MRTLVLVTLLAVVCPSSARAATITLNSDFQGTSVVFALNGQNYGSTLGSILASGGAGLGGALDAPNSSETYCVDFFTGVFFPDDHLPHPPATFDVAAPGSLMSGWTATNGLNSATAGQSAAWLYNTYATTFAGLDTGVGLAERAALQIAIWNVLYDGDFSVAATGGGSTYVRDNASDPTSQVRTFAQSYLDALAISPTVASSDAAWLRLSYVNPTGLVTDAQDFIGPLASATQVPEPAAGLLLGVGVACLAGFRRLRRV